MKKKQNIKNNNIKLDIVNLFDEIISKGKYSNIQLNYYFTEKKYTPKEKLFIKNIVNITLKNLIYVDYLLSKATKNIQKRKIKQLLRISTAQLFFMNSDNAGIVYEAGEIAKIINKHQVSFVNATLQTILKNKEKYDSEIPLEKRDGILLSYPQWFVNKLKIDYPENYLEIMKSYKDRSYISVRYNKKVFNRDTFENFVLSNETEILFSVDEVYTLSNGNILTTEHFKNGNIVIQDASSYLAVKNLDISDNDIVLDACSAPGGKSLAILQTFNPKLLVATDIHEHKIEMLNNLKEKYNYENFEIRLNDATEIEKLNQKFDKILLDVPCSGLGVLRKKPEKIYTLTNDQIKELKKLQKKIFSSAYNALKEGGTIVYSTCTFSKNENTNNLEYFLEKYDDLKVEDVIVPENVKTEKDSSGGIYITYENDFLDGFYIAKLRKAKKMEG